MNTYVLDAACGVRYIEGVDDNWQHPDRGRSPSRPPSAVPSPAALGHRLIVLVTKLAINALALIVVDALFARLWLADLTATLAAAVLLAAVNTYLRPVVLLLTLPITIFTLGLFTIVVNALMLWLVSRLLPGFHLEGFWTATGSALVISLISVFLNLFLLAGGVQVRVRRG